jgi:recombination protein RecR
MIHTSQSIEKVIEHLSHLPGIGKKTAQRLALYILKLPKEEVRSLAESLINLKERITYCTICSNITETDPCIICSNPKRDRSVLCIVEEPKDVLAIERTNEFRGLYHVLGGAISPLDGIGPEDLKITELLERIEGISRSEEPKIGEIILALDPNVEGETTTIYLGKLLKPFNITVTRIARGLPIGSDIEFADAATLARAIEGRVLLR